MNDDAQWQAPLPKHYKLPPVVNPKWQLLDLFKFKNAKESLEQIICRQYGVKHCLLLDRARSGLYLLIKSMGLNGEWITSSFMHRPACVLIKNHIDRLILSSINDDFNIDVDDVEALLSPKTQTILATHMYGKGADIVRLRELADKSGLFLIENAVHMPGNTEVQNKKLGSWGDAAILSFNVDKPAGAILGGALITNRDDVWEAVQKQTLKESNGPECWNRIYTSFLAYYLKPLVLKLPGTKKLRQEKDGIQAIEQFSFGKYKEFAPRTIHTLQAAAAIEGFRRSDDIVARRIKNAEILSGLLAEHEKIVLPTTSDLCPNTYLYYPIRLSNDVNRYTIGCRLSQMGIESKWRYYPLHLQPGFTDCRHSDMTKTMLYWQQHILLPANADVTEQQLTYLAKSLLSLL